MTTRRNFLKSSAMLAAGGILGSSVLSSCGSKDTTPAAATAPTKKSFIGLQTYSLGRELSEDIPSGLAKLAQIGYTDLELAGYRDGKIGEVSMSDYRKMADDAGLKISGSHLSPSIREYKKENFQQFEDFWKKAVDEHTVLGVTTMVQPSMPSVKTMDEAKVVGEIFNKAGEIAKAAGIAWGYHNHSGEFGRLEPTAEQKAEYEKQVAAAGNNPMMRMRAPQGDYIEKAFIDNTDPNYVMFELDCYWAVMGQQDPCEWLRNYPNRYKLLHVKDRWIVGNSGMMNWENIFKTGYSIGINQWFVEVESDSDPNTTQFYGVEESAKYLLAAPFVKA